MTLVENQGRIRAPEIDSGLAAVANEAGACLGGQSGDYTQPRAGKQGPCKKDRPTLVSTQKVKNDLGPVHLLALKGQPSPTIHIDRYDTMALVYIDNPPWGWGRCCREFLDPQSPSIEAHAFAQMQRLRGAAFAEKVRREKRKKTAWLERHKLDQVWSDLERTGLADNLNAKGAANDER